MVKGVFKFVFAVIVFFLVGFFCNPVLAAVSASIGANPVWNLNPVLVLLVQVGCAGLVVAK